jgi:hypothetical protein
MLGGPHWSDLEEVMLRQMLWTLFDVVAGLITAGLLAPVAVLIAPEPFRGSAALWGLALACVALTTVARRFGLGRLARRRR